MKKLYETDSYICSNETIVTNSYEENGEFYIELEESVFFPEEGGQYADTGYIDYNGIKVEVLDGRCIGKAGSREQTIDYRVSQMIPTGERVSCFLDWNKRFMRMQNHSAEHILTGLIHNKYGFDNVGFHLSDEDYVTLDLNGVIDYEQVLEMEEAANEVVCSNLPITAYFPDEATLKATEYRSKIDIEGTVRLVKIGDDNNTVDVCACCAPHVSRTGEIGLIKVVSVINWKGGIQIAMLAGARAREYVNRELAILNTSAKLISSSSVNVPVMLESYRNEIVDLKQKLTKSMEALALEQINRLADNEPKCVFMEDDCSSVVMKNVYNELTKRFSGFVGVFAGSEENGYRYNAGSSKLDSRELATLLREKLGAKGGGNSEMIQGKITASKEAIKENF